MVTGSALEQFANQKYLNLETYRRNGSGVRTPVWFVEKDGKLYVRTGAKSGKAKRIRNFPQVQVAPCKAQGEVIGHWVKGIAHRVDEGTAKVIDQLFAKKYGLQKAFFDFLGRIQKFETATYEILLENPEPLGSNRTN
ncbi:MAG: PPOX class F420-dependent oxidoreductase [Anaerolineales bacterium]|nr:PPOX class F420-dependent oxidoreductase [Anaerolineales bacterium]MCS7248185.1 PPOX class F420-dependent oxidoreductase [Anaerolineales bacterium]MDW8161998.1 PPOX class F420-dependent oxidoreductase [Anaerolineales bacterium]MDW8446169.1 PPOX class F420-dependent oxidoreductase [Anaerolineales bacterium]